MQRDSTALALELQPQDLRHLSQRALHEYQVGNSDEVGAILDGMADILVSGRPVVGPGVAFTAIALAFAARQFDFTRYVETGKTIATASAFSHTPIINESGRI